MERQVIKQHGFKLVPNKPHGAITEHAFGISFKAQPRPSARHYPKTVQVRPDGHEAGIAIVPYDPHSPVYPPGVAKRDLTRQVTQTVLYQEFYSRQPLKAPTHTTLAFTRTALIDYTAAVPTVTYQPWQARTTAYFAALHAPAIPGYMAVFHTLAAVAAAPEDPDFVDVFYYVRAKDLAAIR